MLMPSALAALRFRNSSTFVLCWTGRSAGFALENPAGIYSDEAMMTRSSSGGLRLRVVVGSGGSAASITCHEPRGGRCRKPDHPHTRTAAGAKA